MKKPLLKPPTKDGQILFLPQATEFAAKVSPKSSVATAHQPYFFNPGVSLKFLLLQNLPQENKKILFVDTDKVQINLKIPLASGNVCLKEFIMSEKVLSDYPRPSQDQFIDFFNYLKEQIKRSEIESWEDIWNNILNFKDIVLNKKSKLLKEVLAESFLEFYGITKDYQFVSDIIKSKDFSDFFEKIYKDNDKFREIFNASLDEYGQEFRFRFKNWPFPRLAESELPFWVLKDGQRIRCFKKDIDFSDIKKFTIFPRAVTLTIFLRLYMCDVFIHGVGGANYDWIGNKVIDRFFKKEVPFYVVASGTFLLKNFSVRDFPYFFFNPADIKKSMDKFVTQNLALTNKIPVN